VNNNDLRSSRSALRQLVIVLAIVIGVAIYAYGWNTTDISLDEVQDETRQASVQRAMRELLSPDLFTRDREQKPLLVEFQIGCPSGDLPDGRVNTDSDAYMVFTPPCADPDDIVNITGYDFPAGAIARIQLVQESGQKLPFKLADVTGAEAEVSEEAIFDIDGDGYFDVDVKVPKGRGLSGKTHQVEIQAAVPSGWPHLSDTSETVIDKMIETIFLALMATTLALPASVFVSFIAARNLMRDVTLPLGNVLVGFVLMPVGGFLGYRLLGPLGKLGVEWGEDVIPGIIGSVVAIAAFAVISRRLGKIKSKRSALIRVPAIATNVLLLAVIVFVFGVIGGLGIWLGEQLIDVDDQIEDEDRIGLDGDVGVIIDDTVDSVVSVRNLSGFTETLGTLIDLIIVGIAAVGGAMWLGSLARLWPLPDRCGIHSPLNILGAVLDFQRPDLLGVMAYIGGQAIPCGHLLSSCGAGGRQRSRLTGI
jgi:ABC-type phosphate/phosphonate transport system permease subunit